jgi:enamine deaminase RidA (YjgF/YER057c/UK114 family)
MKTERVFSRSPWEKQVGYCRAIRRGDFISVSGTVAITDDGQIFEPGNTYAQTKRCFQIVNEALNQLRSSLSDVVRTRLFVADISQWAEYGRAHNEVFEDYPPASSMVEVKSFIAKGIMVEIEVDAVCMGLCELAGL